MRSNQKIARGNHCRWFMGLGLASALALHLLAVSSLDAQQPPNVQSLPRAHDLQDGYMIPGTIGKQRMLVRQEMIGYMQPVQFVIPKDASISVWNGKEYAAIDPAKSAIRMQVGAVYRLKVSNIPRRPDRDVYPSIEIINRLYPPPEQADRFPVMVHITQDELEKAADGYYVHRVTYLEDPETALPFRQAKGDQAYFRVRQDQDPLKVAANLGRPMTLVRMGSRVPKKKGKDGKFAMAGAPLEIVNLVSPQVSSQPVKRDVRSNQPAVPPAIDTNIKKAGYVPKTLVKKNPDNAAKSELNRNQSEFLPPIKNADEMRRNMRNKRNTNGKENNR